MSNPSFPPKSAKSSFLLLEKQTVFRLWIADMLESAIAKADLYGRDKLQAQCNEFLDAFIAAYAQDQGDDMDAVVWQEVKQIIVDVAKTRAAMGFTPTETTHFVFSLKKALFEVLIHKGEVVGQALIDEMQKLYHALEQLAVLTFEAFSRTREELITRQTTAILELSCPVIKIWDRVLLCVVIGTVDTARIQQILEAVLTSVKTMEARVAIIDITGVSVIDTSVVQHLFTIVRGVRLMGAQPIITGVTPAVAATVTKLQIDLRAFNSQGSLRAGLAESFRLLNIKAPLGGLS